MSDRHIKYCIHCRVCRKDVCQAFDCDNFIFSQRIYDYENINQKYLKVLHENDELKRKIEKLTNKNKAPKRYIVYYYNSTGYTSTTIVIANSVNEAGRKFYDTVGGYGIIKIEEVKFDV